MWGDVLVQCSTVPAAQAYLLYDTFNLINLINLIERLIHVYIVGFLLMRRPRIYNVYKVKYISTSYHFGPLRQCTSLMIVIMKSQIFSKKVGVMDGKYHWILHNLLTMDGKVHWILHHLLTWYHYVLLMQFRSSPLLNHWMSVPYICVNTCRLIKKAGKYIFANYSISTQSKFNAILHVDLVKNFRRTIFITFWYICEIQQVVVKGQLDWKGMLATF